MQLQGRCVDRCRRGDGMREAQKTEAEEQTQACVREAQRLADTGRPSLNGSGWVCPVFPQGVLF